MINRRAELQEFADSLGLDYCVLAAVIKVETNGTPFLADGRPAILFEGHVFWRELNRLALDPRLILAQKPEARNVLYPIWTKKYYEGGAGEYERLQRAEQIHREAARRSTSWGLFQIMGFNHQLCGCNSVDEFVTLQNTLQGQLQCAGEFLRRGKYLDMLKAQDWETFARRYNGPNHARNKYAQRLREAYEQCQRG